MNTEAIDVALFALLKATTGITESARKLKHWDDVPVGQQPALFLVDKGSTNVVQTNQPTRITLHREVYLYAHTGDDPTAGPSSILNPLVDSIRASVHPSGVNERQTLGGLVHYCRIEGKIETDEGTLGDQGVVIIPIDLYTTD